MIAYLLKGIFIGLLFGLPIGAVGTMSVQRTWNYGFRAGLVSGLGSSIADCLYAIVGAFGLTFISNFLLQYQNAIHFLGGGLVLLMGIKLILKNQEASMKQLSERAGVKMFLSSFAIGITNPTAILTFIFAFSYFGISEISGIRNGSLLVCGVFIGTYIWWTLLSGVTCFIKNKTNKLSLHSINKVFGGILSLFGAVIFIQSLIN